MGNLDNFLEDQKEPAKMSACLEENLPYMTMKSKTNSEENAEPFDWASTQRRLETLGKDESSGLSLQLGAEYEQKKQKLQEELHSEYRRFVAQKKDLHTVKTDPHATVLSLPIDERRLAKERLRDERNKEYNLFLKGWSGQTRRQSSKPAEAPEVESSAALNSHPAIPGARISRPWDPPPPKKDAATLTDGGTGTEGRVPRGRRRWDPHRPEDSLEHRESRRPRRRSRRMNEYSSEEYLSTDEEIEFLERRRQRRSHKPKSPERGERTVHERPGRSLVMPVAMKTIERSRSAATKDREGFTTGLMIGTSEEDAATRMRKDRYKQELLEQMAEGRRNKQKEKDLELRVAATGAVDPEKQPDRIKQFGVVNRVDKAQRRDMPTRPGVGLHALGPNCSPRHRQQRPGVGTEVGVPPGRPRVAFPSLPMPKALGQLPGAEDFPRSLSSTLGEMIVPRVANQPPPWPPPLSDAYQTPYDEAYLYFGARNPLDPDTPHYGPPVSGEPTLIFPHQPTGMTPLPGHQGARRTNQHPVALLNHGLGVGSIGERPKQSKESLLNYQEALRKQIKEKERGRREEREARDRYDVMLEAESEAFDPWGKGGGGAPLKDDRGNLISDLNRMHRSNEEACVNPESRDRGKPQVSGTRRGGGGGGPPPTGEDTSASTHRPSDFSQPSQFARGNMFSDQRTPQQLQDRGTYKDFLKQQMDDKRRREAEEKDRERMEEEREEKKVEEQRIRIQKEFEEEQDRKRLKEVEQSAKNEELIRQAEERRKEADRKRREEEERESESLKKLIERERKADRANSPVIPALQKKLDKLLTPRPPSQFSSRALSGRPVSAPHPPPPPARRNQLQVTESPQGVIRELSTLRRQLRSEQRRLEGQLLHGDRKDTDTPLPNRGHPRGDAFEVARIGARVLPRRVATHVNVQNFREFNLLKHRDSASCEEVRSMYPNPPIDDHTLDIQQQALLRSQQSRIRDMRSGGHPDYEASAVRQPRHHARENPGHQRVHLLESESAFIDYPSGGPGSVNLPSDYPSGGPGSRVVLRTRQPSAQERRSPPRRRDQATAGGQRGNNVRPASQTLSSMTSLNVGEVRDRVRRLQDFSERDGRSDEGDDLSLRSTPFHPDRRVSIETVATEPWLRPGTSDTPKRFGAGQNRSGAGY